MRPTPACPQAYPSLQMARSKLRMELIGERKRRNATFAKRAEGMKKKARELAELCDIPTLLVCFGPEGQVEAWPDDPHQARAVVDRYRNFHGDLRHKHRSNISTFYGDGAGGASEGGGDGAAMWEAPLELELELERSLDAKLQAIEERIRVLCGGEEAAGDPVGTPWSSYCEISAPVDEGADLCAGDQVGTPWSSYCEISAPVEEGADLCSGHCNGLWGDVVGGDPELLDWRCEGDGGDGICYRNDLCEGTTQASLDAGLLGYPACCTPCDRPNDGVSCLSAPPVYDPFLAAADAEVGLPCACGCDYGTLQCGNGGSMVNILLDYADTHLAESLPLPMHDGSPYFGNSALLDLQREHPVLLGGCWLQEAGILTAGSTGGGDRVWCYEDTCDVELADGVPDGGFVNPSHLFL